MPLSLDSRKLSAPAKIDLYMLDLNPINVAQAFYFYPGTDANSQNVVFQGDTYTPWVVNVTGIEKRGTGSSPRPSATIGNANQFVTNLCQQYQDLVGARVRRRRTLSTYVINNTAAYIDEYYLIEQRTAETYEIVTFNLASPLDFLDKQLPGMIAISTSCPFIYKSTANGSGCSWPGTDASKWFNANDVSVASAGLDNCSKKLSGCKLRFGQNNPLDYGGNPGLGRSNY